MDRRITIQRPATVTDTVYGPQDSGWETVVSRVPAQVQDDRTRDTETNNGDLRMASRPARVRMRYIRGITSDMRVILHDEVDRICQISSTPIEIGRREATEFAIDTYTS
ncbi:hypothetical protein Q3G72_011227 [Acer saccharum]|nr:hypothetical protein Q3G72_011227 [Acer saccharum]